MAKSGGVDRIGAETLGALTVLGSGGQGTVWALPGDPTSVYKEYTPQALAMLDPAALEAMVAFPVSLPGRQALALRARAAWPTALVERGGRVTGFLMPRVPPPFHARLWLTRDYQERLGQVQLLLNDPAYLDARRLTVDDRLRLELLHDTAETLALFHELGIVVGDLSPNNLLFSTTCRPRCYFIDCDAMRLRGATVLPQIETQDWQVPSSDEATGTPGTDAYKFALLCVRLFAGDQVTRDTAVLRPLGAAVQGLAGRGLTAGPDERPALAQWQEALRGALKAYKPPRPAPTRPSSAPPVHPARAGAAGPPRPAGGVRPAGGMAVRPRRRLRPGRLVLLALVAAVLIWATPHLAAVRTWWQDGVAAGSTTGATTSPSEQAARVAELLAGSGHDRTQVISAIEGVIACRKPSAASVALGRAAAGRDASLARANRLRTDQLPDGTELKAQLVAALTHSRAADEAYRRWAAAVASAGCRSAAMKGADRARGDAESAKARTAKKRVAQLWNPVAKRYGHPTVSYLDI